MLMHIKQLLERNRYAIAASFTLLIIYLSLAPTSNAIDVIDVSDKTLHTFAYFVLALSWIFAIKSSHAFLKQKMSIGFFVLVLSILLELLQGSLTDYRTADYLDIVANTIGIIIAIVSFKYLLQLYNTI
ncbi:VanZ family protein [Urechidicola vernalis]|uniref:VanZ family protein n=1 Tax=Urechidicola vernalis TaxID=3075600 RepID=A0ABU2Y9S4_9FLAO|nr:VanZ family protein [Urechidicola sp. P050]MDT0554005.1 VanZ family protein [Urechidicola sp. P050]